MIFRFSTTKRLAALAAFAILGFALLSPPPAAARTLVKMATLVPEGSVWDKALRDMGAEWQEATGGEVQLRIYAGGVAGDESDIVRKMRIGQIHAAALTTGGLAEIADSFRAFEIPMFFDSYEELFYVLEELRPELEERLDENGFILLGWGHGGWVHLFSKKPIRTVDDLRSQKLFTWAGNDQMVQLWRKNGFQPVALSATDVLTGLQTGMIEAIPTTPLAALSLQWFRQTPYMQDIGFAPLVGAIVISKRTWAKISAEDQAKLLAAARETEALLAREIPKQDQRAVEQMTKRGMEIVAVDEATRATWRTEAEDFIATKRQMIETPELLDRVKKARDAFRAEHADAEGGP